MSLFSKYGYVVAAIVVILLNAIVAVSAFPDGLQLKGEAAHVVGLAIPYIAKTQSHFIACGYESYANYVAAIWLLIWASFAVYAIFFIFGLSKKYFYIPLGKNIIFNFIKLIIFGSIVVDTFDVFYLKNVSYLNSCDNMGDINIQLTILPIMILIILLFAFVSFVDASNVISRWLKLKKTNV